MPRATNVQRLGGWLGSRKPAEAETLARQSLDIRRLSFCQSHRWTAESLKLLGGILRQQGQPTAADPLRAEADQIQERLRAQ